ncbi:hypothetical protein Csp1_03730 [Corynebacterium provencense]|uniref:Uncharacterized protein n=1 Tax=Corynebacterium provencense TaxID=1737425 RepID=A0A2Z3YT32_9CORY|nr:hypothetical protein [Corynebacterium provencense]AWT25197.1 hypothetical protein Csp1_03730 [Corynebacterium provencense]
MTNSQETSDTSTPPVVEQYLTSHPDIFAVELTEDNTTPRHPR